MAIDSRRWFHSELSGLAAEKLLIEKGEPGSFLIRQSHNSPGNFTLSVRRKDSFAHIRIQNTGDFLSFFGGDKFATLPELVNYYREHPDQLKEKNGSIIELRHPLMVDDYSSESARWFHGRQTANEAQNLLLQKGKYGSFLVRESVRQPGSYVLSVVTGDSNVSHILVNHLPNSKFDLGDGHEFSSLGQLIDHYTAFPIMVKDGHLICLKQPFNVTRLNVSCLDQRITQLEKKGVRGKRVTGFWEEFEELHQDAHEGSRMEGRRPCNLAKNRYKNILPFDATRVILRDADPNVPGSDYINANYISNPAFLLEGLQPSTTLTKDEKKSKETEINKDREEEENEGNGENARARSRRGRVFFSSRPQYIATQGVLPGTIVDMWRMIWQERSSIVVMLTKENERGRNKCEKYWPTEVEGSLLLPVPLGTLKVTPMSERNLISHVIRELKISLHQRLTREGRAGETEREEDDSFTVFLLQFLAWPDHGTPSEPSEFLDLLFNISSYQENMETMGPMIVHCSSGIGRTGTLIVTDMLLGCIREGGLHTDIDIARTVQAVREQRSGMVQTEAQYRFIYKAVQEFVSGLLLRVKLRNALKPFGIDYTNLKQTPRSEGCLCCTGTATLPHSSSFTLSSSLPNSSHGFWTSRSINCQRPVPPPLAPPTASTETQKGFTSEETSVTTTAAGAGPSSSKRWYKLSSASR
ncbi:Tyrosine-protein phosphatase non-receptor type 11 [Echinococcus granulosus]|uniref:protein-tyrosine-phosphatase n=1 Tax=Echinococcus granulosus TaxID=6210 RepID=U6JGQ4_ECHGR|nr:Tyrosine-protein phosphatase non-receptor type 11 [Echinococcus granulosus]EUB61468.1 Tyrosine-protein phosphatase non-receptor type 11 [Echinococcus granulosus]KAH9284148.1 Tyrosine-protein phosphatase non-receptor type 11 [Echinococcus granulosus]CDS23237.1 tyrosine protein phosphatase non receptor type [Echinococcus granulosus]